ncbi:Hypothetical Protein FCC1311_060992 [Hondaea fermentalgiana]|uniref:Uncharacterized protein n=1 Tax=Hondaea fermentalgiana TaxID=2315210 RepID=A0A2R5GHR3_9STRA|nr:Hypothetical Protein FCC1311_060992 [Hondaea fermentalgiana]|eukprot:GBG29879.1 Hypothetical Protein FCC1311_060992 [Hondaea fermentalgiana]
MEMNAPRVVWVGLVDSLKGSLMFSRVWDVVLPQSETDKSTTHLRGASLAVALFEKSRVAWTDARTETQLCTFRNGSEIVMLVRSINDVIYIVAGTGDTVELDQGSRATPDAIRAISASIAVFIDETVAS